MRISMLGLILGLLLSNPLAASPNSLGGWLREPLKCWEVDGALVFKDETGSRRDVPGFQRIGTRWYRENSYGGIVRSESYEFRSGILRRYDAFGPIPNHHGWTRRGRVIHRMTPGGDISGVRFRVPISVGCLFLRGGAR